MQFALRVAHLILLVEDQRVCLENDLFCGVFLVDDKAEIIDVCLEEGCEATWILGCWISCEQVLFIDFFAVVLCLNLVEADPRADFVEMLLDLEDRDDFLHVQELRVLALNNAVNQESRVLNLSEDFMLDARNRHAKMIVTDEFKHVFDHRWAERQIQAID